MELIATKSLRYAGRSLVAGDKFEASDKDARLLKAIKKAADASRTIDVVDAETGERATVYATTSYTIGDAVAGKKRRYKTRQMKADDDTTSQDEGEEERPIGEDS